MPGSRSDAVAFIEARFGEVPHCPRCASRSIRPSGRSGDLRRHRCRVRGRTLTALSGTPLSGLHKRGVRPACAQALRDQASVRRAAKRCAIDKTTSFRWRHRFLDGPREDKAEALRDIVEESILVSDAASRFDASAASPRRPASPTSPSTRARAKRVAGVFHLQNVNACQSRRKTWMHPFKGVATKHLPNDPGWHRMIARNDRPPSPATCLAAAVG
jgi:transposase-like protein